MLTDCTYFTGELSLPAIKEDSGKTGSDAVMEKLKNRELNAFIEKYERQFLELLFGESFTDSFYSGLNLPDDDPEKEKWTALKNELCIKRELSKESPIACYVYRFYLIYLRDNTTSTGVKKSKATFADNVSDTRKLVSSWNNMVGFNKKFMNRFIKNDTYKSYTDGHIPDRDLLTPINSMNL
ncbi:MAG: hypothetical protein FWF53_04485 [Candidatus Azobacteroides sp.]|nr:hypothetical protein [Candidatus Azobacteroides sp.]